MSKGPSIILRIYFAVVAAVTLFTLMYGAIDFLTIGLKTYVFPAADVPEWGLVNCDDPTVLGGYYETTETGVKLPARTVEDEEASRARCETSNATQLAQYQMQKANAAVRNLALVLVSLPLFILHFRVVYRDWKAERDEK